MIDITLNNIEIKLDSVIQVGGDSKSPLLVFIHGLGGTASQFTALLDYFGKFANCLAINFPGSGNSPIITDWNLYTTESSIEILKLAIEAVDIPHSGTIFIGHSMGSVVALLSARKAVENKEKVAAICICPPGPTSPFIKRIQQILPWVPPIVFDGLRALDRRGGVESKSVKRMLSPQTTDDAIKQAQLRQNLSVTTNVWLRQAAGAMPPDVIEPLNCPILIISAKDDTVTPPAAAKVLADNLGDMVETKTILNAGHSVMLEQPQEVRETINNFIATCFN